MRQVNNIVFHCTATPQKTTIKSIQRYWKENLKWKNPGYHIVIKPCGWYVRLAPDGTICNGVSGHNHDSIHISYIGGIDEQGKAVDNRTTSQKKTMITLAKTFRSRYPNARILGHRDFSKDKNNNGIIDPWERIKECPCFDAKIEYEGI